MQALQYTVCDIMPSYGLGRIDTDPEQDSGKFDHDHGVSMLQQTMVQWSDKACRPDSSHLILRLLQSSNLIWGLQACHP